jgi:hypothetical protein
LITPRRPSAVGKILPASLKHGTIIEHFGEGWVDMELWVVAGNFSRDPNIASKM